MSSRLAVVPSVLPAAVLALAMAGQAKEPLAAAALGGGVLVLVWSVALAVVLVVQLVRGASCVPVLVGLGFSSLAVLAVVVLVVDAPLWVQWRAEPAIRAIERTRAEGGAYPNVGSFDGDFPSSLRATLDASGHCIYRPRGKSYHLLCLGPPFTRCGYDGATRRWSGSE